jgi:hypothetical protein
MEDLEKGFFFFVYGVSFFFFLIKEKHSNKKRYSKHQQVTDTSTPDKTGEKREGNFDYFFFFLFLFDQRDQRQSGSIEFRKPKSRRQLTCTPFKK